MAYESNKDSIGVFPAGSGTLERYRGVKLVAGELVAPTAGGSIVGVVQLDNPNDGQATPIQVSGIAKMEAATSFAADTLLGVDADGKVAPAASVITGGGTIIGQAITASGAAGNIVSVLLDI